MKEENKNIIELDKNLITELLQGSAKELQNQRKSKRNWFFFKAGLFVLFFVSAYFVGGTGINFKDGDKNQPHIASVEIYGPIMSGQLADAGRLIPSLHKALNTSLVKGVVLRINSPGGSPVHAGRMYQEIKKLRKEFPDKPIHAVIEDLGASAAYYIASAADKIYVDQASMVGSIGVISSSFGFTEVMEKVGIERRLYTAGTNKALMDPYSPSLPNIDKYWTEMLAEIHQQFIAAVKEGRGDRLKAEYPELFSGLIWTGAKSIEIGLSDELGSIGDVSREILDGELNIVNYTPPIDILKRFASESRAQVSAFFLENNTPHMF